MLKSLVILLILTSSFVSCSTKKKNLDVEWYKGNSDSAALERKQDGKSIKCTQELINEYFCLSMDDLAAIMMYMEENCGCSQVY